MHALSTYLFDLARPRGHRQDQIVHCAVGWSHDRRAPRPRARVLIPRCRPRRLRRGQCGRPPLQLQQRHVGPREIHLGGVEGRPRRIRQQCRHFRVVGFVAQLQLVCQLTELLLVELAELAEVVQALGEDGGRVGRRIGDFNESGVLGEGMRARSEVRGGRGHARLQDRVQSVRLVLVKRHVKRWVDSGGRKKVGRMGGVGREIFSGRGQDA